VGSFFCVFPVSLKLAIEDFEKMKFAANDLNNWLAVGDEGVWVR
jgi:hypothetical protein